MSEGITAKRSSAGIPEASGIPKIIHYCWFGGNDLGAAEERCIDSWRKFFPDYEIKRWDESNFDITCCEYVAEAYRAKKWAFVSDYARFAILYKEGGLYFDTDVEVIKSMEDIISAGPFMGFETDFSGHQGVSDDSGKGFVSEVAPGLGLAAGPEFALYKQILDSYSSDHFIRPDGSYDTTTVVVRVTDILRRRGLRDTAGIQNVSGVSIYPSEYFNPKDYQTGRIVITSNTRSIHHFTASWQTPLQHARHGVKMWIKKHEFIDRLVFSTGLFGGDAK